MATPKVEFLTNAPLFVVPKYADVVASKQGYNDQVCIKGTFDGHGDGACYLPITTLEQFERLGILGRTGVAGKFSKEKLNVLKPIRCQILKTEQGTNKIVTISIPGGGASERPANAGGSRPANQQQTQQGASKPAGINFARLVLTMDHAVKNAKEVVGRHFEGVPTETLLPFIQAAAVSLFIDASKRDLIAPAPKAPEPFADEVTRAEVVGLMQKIGMDAGKKFLNEIAKTTDVNKLTVSQAAAAIRVLTIEWEEMQQATPEDDGSSQGPDPQPSEDDSEF